MKIKIKNDKKHKNKKHTAHPNYHSSTNDRPHWKECMFCVVVNKYDSKREGSNMHACYIHMRFKNPNI